MDQNQKFIRDTRGIGSYGRLVIIYFFLGAALQVGSSAHCDLAGSLNISNNSDVTGCGGSGINSSTIDIGRINASIPNEPAAATGPQSSGTTNVFLEPLIAAFGAARAAFTVAFWPTELMGMMLPSLGFPVVLGQVIGLGLTLVFWVSFFLWVRGGG